MIRNEGKPPKIIPTEFIPLLEIESQWVNHGWWSAKNEMFVQRAAANYILWRCQGIGVPKNIKRMRSS
jgi:hypothetical protein